MTLRQRLTLAEDNIRALRARLVPAWRVEQDVFLGSYPKGVDSINGLDLASQLKCLGHLGMRCEVRLNNGIISLYAIKRVDA